MTPVPLAHGHSTYLLKTPGILIFLPPLAPVSIMHHLKENVKHSSEMWSEKNWVDFTTDTSWVSVRDCLEIPSFTFFFLLLSYYSYNFVDLFRSSWDTVNGSFILIRLLLLHNSQSTFINIYIWHNIGLIFLFNLPWYPIHYIYFHSPRQFHVEIEKRERKRGHTWKVVEQSGWKKLKWPLCF